jgi:hypothetical protein
MMASVSEILGETNAVLYAEDPMMNNTQNVKRGMSGPSTAASDGQTAKNDETKEPTNSELVVYLKKIVNKMSDMDEKLKRLEIVEKKVDNFESEMKKLWSHVHGCDTRTEVRLHKVDVRVTAVEEKTVEFEKSVAYVSNKIDDFQVKCKELDKMSDNFRKHDIALKTICVEIDNMSKEREDLKESVTDLRCRSMQYNLVFTGLCGESYDEDTEAKLRDFIFCELDIGGDRDHIEFSNVHRFGRFISGRSRPIVAKFVLHRDLQRVKESAYKLKGKPFGINEQFPAEIEARRKVLYPVVRRLKQEGKRPRLIRDRIYTNGKLYDPSFDRAKATQQNIFVEKSREGGRPQNPETVPKSGSNSPSTTPKRVVQEGRA